jgi:tRNA-Thr(GGU) m(6)t(6)A37 methyltransferase TsaA
MNSDFCFPPIGILRSCFHEKFGVPRQSLMMSEARAILKLNPDPDFRSALNHLEEFTHIWLVFVFHQAGPRAWRPTIRPPRLDAPRRVGVFASRSPHRPNPIGISAVRLDRIDLDAPGGIELHLSGIDLLDGTPILDIKPYLPYADSVPHAGAGWAHSEIPHYDVSFGTEAQTFLSTLPTDDSTRLSALIEQTLSWDPRPTSQRRAMPIESPESQGMKFGLRIADFEVKWRIHSSAIEVLQILTLREQS